MDKTQLTLIEALTLCLSNFNDPHAHDVLLTFRDRTNTWELWDLSKPDTFSDYWTEPDRIPVCRICRAELTNIVARGDLQLIAAIINVYAHFNLRRPLDFQLDQLLPPKGYHDHAK